MALVAVATTLKQSLGLGATYSVEPASAGTVGSAPATATVAADVATLVADGASPTQAHVTTLNTDWGTLLAAINTYVSQVNGSTGDVTLTINTANVTNKRQLQSALRDILARIDGSNILTP